MTLNEWIAHVDQLRQEDEWLALGEWRGYKRDPMQGGAYPAKGEYVLARWATPSVIVAEDEPDAAVALARLVERALDAAA